MLCRCRRWLLSCLAGWRLVGAVVGIREGVKGVQEVVEDRRAGREVREVKEVRNKKVVREYCVHGVRKSSVPAIYGLTAVLPTLLSIDGLLTDQDVCLWGNFAAARKGGRTASNTRLVPDYIEPLFALSMCERSLELLRDKSPSHSYVHCATYSCFCCIKEDGFITH